MIHSTEAFHSTKQPRRDLIPRVRHPKHPSVPMTVTPSFVDQPWAIAVRNGFNSACTCLTAYKSKAITPVEASAVQLQKPPTRRSIHTSGKGGTDTGNSTGPELDSNKVKAARSESTADLSGANIRSAASPGNSVAESDQSLGTIPSVNKQPPIIPDDSIPSTLRTKFKLNGKPKIDFVLAIRAPCFLEQVLVRRDVEFVERHEEFEGRTIKMIDIKKDGTTTRGIVLCHLQKERYANVHEKLMKFLRSQSLVPGGVGKLEVIVVIDSGVKVYDFVGAGPGKTTTRLKREFDWCTHPEQAFEEFCNAVMGIFGGK